MTPTGQYVPVTTIDTSNHSDDSATLDSQLEQPSQVNDTIETQPRTDAKEQLPKGPFGHQCECECTHQKPLSTLDFHSPSVNGVGGRLGTPPLNFEFLQEYAKIRSKIQKPLLASISTREPPFTLVECETVCFLLDRVCTRSSHSQHSRVCHTNREYTSRGIFPLVSVHSLLSPSHDILMIDFVLLLLLPLYYYYCLCRNQKKDRIRRNLWEASILISVLAKEALALHSSLRACAFSPPKPTVACK